MPSQPMQTPLAIMGTVLASRDVTVFFHASS